MVEVLPGPPLLATGVLGEPETPTLDVSFGVAEKFRSRWVSVSKELPFGLGVFRGLPTPTVVSIYRVGSR